MHPTLEQLLSLRDGDAPEGVRDHVATCPECASELERLQHTVEGLRRLQPLGPTRDLWPGLREHVLKERRRNRRALVTVAASLLLTAALVTAVVLVKQQTVPTVPVQAAAGQPSAAPSQQKDIQPLIAESQRLEGVLRQANAGSPVMTGKTATTIAHLEDNIAILDLQISILGGAGEKQAQLKRLWQQRVKLLQTLVQVHTSRGEYAQL